MPRPKYQKKLPKEFRLDEIEVSFAMSAGGGWFIVSGEIEGEISLTYKKNKLKNNRVNYEN